jgi:hypothetical protein
MQAHSYILENYISWQYVCVSVLFEMILDTKETGNIMRVLVAFCNKTLYAGIVASDVDDDDGSEVVLVHVGRDGGDGDATTEKESSCRERQGR